MTAERLPRFVPSPMVDHRYLVTVLRNRYDTDEGKFTDTVTAIGPVGARRTAEDKWLHKYPDLTVVHVEEVVLDPDYHEDCGYAWSAHQSPRTPYEPQPFGCPSEAQARARWGR